MRAKPLRARKPEKTQGIASVFKLAGVTETLEGSFVVQAGKLKQLELIECGNDSTRWLDAVGIEGRPKPSDRAGEEELAPRGQDPLKFSHGLIRSGRIEGVAVPPKTNVLGHVKA